MSLYKLARERFSYLKWRPGPGRPGLDTQLPVHRSASRGSAPGPSRWRTGPRPLPTAPPAEICVFCSASLSAVPAPFLRNSPHTPRSPRSVPTLATPAEAFPQPWRQSDWTKVGPLPRPGLRDSRTQGTGLSKGAGLKKEVVEGC